MVYNRKWDILIDRGESLKNKIMSIIQVLITIGGLVIAFDKMLNLFLEKKKN